MAKKARKWSNLDGKLPEEPVNELSPREVAIRKRMDELRAPTVTKIDVSTHSNPDAFIEKVGPVRTMNEFAREYDALCEEEEFAKLEERRRSIEFEALERIILQELQKIKELSGQDMWRGEGQTFSPNFKPIGIISHEEELIKWVRDTGREDFLKTVVKDLQTMVTDALNDEEAMTLTPAQRAALKPGEPGSLQPPPGVSVFLKKGINRRKG